MKKVIIGFLMVSVLLLTACGNDKSETGSSNKAQESTSDSTKSRKTSDSWKLKSMKGKTTLVFSTGEVKAGFPDEGASKEDYKKYLQINVNSSLICEQYGYIGNLHGKIMEWSDSSDSTLKELEIKADAIPSSYFLKDDQDREIAFQLYDEALEKKFIDEYEEEELYIYMQPIPPLNKFDENIRELEEEGATDIVKKIGELEGFKYTYITYHYEDDEPMDGTFYVIYELSDSIRFSYGVRAVGAEFDPQGEVEKMTKNITLEK